MRPASSTAPPSFYTSDNGYLMGEHGQMDTKRWAYEESVRVPLLDALSAADQGRGLSATG